MSSYAYKGKSFSRFRREDYDTYDTLGREIATEFFVSHWGSVADNDGKGTPRTNYAKSDLKVTFDNGDFLYVEPEVKREKHWNWIYKGVHFPLRKPEKLFGVSKYEPKYCQFVMVKSDCSEIILADGRYMNFGWSIWPEHEGFGRVESSPGFKMPKHHCFPVKKFTSRDRSTPEDFIHIDYSHVDHYIRLAKGRFTLKKPSDQRYL